MSLAEVALVEIFYGLDATDLYKMKCCCKAFKQAIEHRGHLQEKIDWYKVNTLAQARDYVHKHDRDFAFQDLLGDYVMYPCSSTRGFYRAIEDHNEGVQKKAIHQTMQQTGVNPRVLAKRASEASQAVVACIKGGADLNTLQECFRFYGIDPATWINDHEQRYTVLHFAARYDRLDVAQACVEMWRCNVNALTHTRANALHYAVHASPELRAYLISVGCDTQQRNTFGTLPPTEQGDAVQIPTSFQLLLNQVLAGYQK